MKLGEGDLYVSSVKGHLVGRPGSGTTATKPLWIGAYAKTEQKPDGSQEFVGVEWATDEVHRIPAIEVQRHLKAYQIALRDQALTVRTKADFEAFLKAQEEATKAAVAKDAEERAKADRAAQAAAADAETKTSNRGARRGAGSDR